MDPKKLIEVNLNNIRGNVLDNEKSTRELVSVIQDLNQNLNPEVSANIMISIRHLEDARMRLGKALQYLGDGVSVYDNQKKPS
jgi:hypothetical protein